MPDTIVPPVATPLVCPECHTPLKPGNITCRSCGVNLALAAGLAERRAVARLTAETAANGQPGEERPIAPETLEAVLRSLVDLAAVKAAFVASVTHDLRAPLVPIRGFADLLRKGRLGTLTAGQQEAAEAIGRAARQLERTLNQLIQAAASPRTDVAINQTSVALPDLADRLWQRLEARAAQAGVTLATEWSPDLRPVRADAEKLYWVLLQLMDNALEVSLRGGRITLGAHEAGAGARIWVRDTAPGLALERAAAADRVGDGTSLGLVRRIIEAHGSRLEVGCQPGAGTTLAFELPLAEAP